MATATHWALPKCILSASLLAAVILMTAGCGDDSTQNASFTENCGSWEDYYSTGESPGEAADGTVRHLRNSVLLKPLEPMEVPDKPPESQVVLIDTRGSTIVCCEWEVYDVYLVASGRGGGIGGIDSSGIGCLRVCYLETHPGEAFSTETDLITGKVTAPGKAILRFSRSDLSTPDPVTPTAGEAKIAPVTGMRIVDINPANSVKNPTLGLVFKINDSPSEHLQIRVARNLRQCVVWNTTTDQEEFRSEPIPR